MIASCVRRGMMTMVLIASTLLGLAWQATSVSAGGVTVYLQPMSATNGAPIHDACFVFVNASEEGCDENGDGYIRYQDIAPGSYTVRQTRDAAGYSSAGDVTILVRSGPQEQTYPIYLQPRSGSSTSGGGTLVDIAIVPTDANTGAALPGACFIVGDVSEEGCDENRDGQVTFADVPRGTYLVRQTRAPDGYTSEPAQTITINGAGQYPFIQGSRSSSGSTTSLVDIALVTRNPDNGNLVTGVCYIIENASIEGCDENGDGQVDFADVPPGTWTVRQTQTPGGYASVRPFDILITGDPTQSFIVKQAASQNDASHRNLSIVLIDQNTGARITGGNACVRVVEASEIGCDENGDGQVDFLDIPVGTHDVRITSLPVGYHGEFDHYSLTVEASDYSIVTVYLPLIRN